MIHIDIAEGSAAKAGRTIGGWLRRAAACTAVAATVAFGAGDAARGNDLAVPVTVEDARTKLADFERAQAPRIAQARAEIAALETALRRAAAEGADLATQAAKAERLAGLSETLARAERAVALIRERIEQFEAQAATQGEDTAPLPPERPRLAEGALPPVPKPWASARFSSEIETLAGIGTGPGPLPSVLGAKMESLESEITALGSRAAQVMGELGQAARASVDGLEGVLRQAGLDVERVLAETRDDFSGLGGPFEPFDPSAPADDTDMRLAALMSNLEQANLMRIAVDRLPFGRPVEVARLTSGYGKRRDPFRRIWSMHTGIDFAAPTGTPIYSTASGIVSFAGRMGGYGNIVIIKHAFGYETRYAHLRRSLVQVGQRVERGEMVAEMGRSGRVTGTHLHYEVRIDEKPVNPRKFIEAARDVL